MLSGPAVSRRYPEGTRVSEPITADRFEAAARDLRPALKRHCYRMTASAQEAEDCVQEAYLRAWRQLGEVRDAAALKPWLYSIATRVCLDFLRGRKRRSAVHDELKSGGPNWVEPMVDGQDEIERRETIRLAFVSMLQTLSPRARAALILHEVLEWTAAEVAGGLAMSLPAARSLIQRARAKMERPKPVDPIPVQSDVLARYMAAWEARDMEAFSGLLSRDAVYVMPPQHQMFEGRAAILAFFAYAWPFHTAMRLVPLSLNGQAGGALYVEGADGWQPHSVHVLDVVDGRIARLTLYTPPLGPELFARFGL